MNLFKLLNENFSLQSTNFNNIFKSNPLTRLNPNLQPLSRVNKQVSSLERLKDKTPRNALLETSCLSHNCTCFIVSLLSTLVSHLSDWRGRGREGAGERGRENEGYGGRISWCLKFGRKCRVKRAVTESGQRSWHLTLAISTSLFCCVSLLHRSEPGWNVEIHFGKGGSDCIGVFFRKKK